MIVLFQGCLFAGWPFIFMDIHFSASEIIRINSKKWLNEKIIVLAGGRTNNKKKIPCTLFTCSCSTPDYPILGLLITLITRLIAIL
jgi:hypothetical protein